MERVRFRMRELAEQQGLTPETLAEKSGISRQHIRRLWHGQVAPRRIRLWTLTRLCQALGVKQLDELITFIQENRTEAPQDAYTLRDLARLFRCRQEVIREELLSGELKGEKTGGRWQIRHQDVEDYLERHTVQGGQEGG